MDSVLYQQAADASVDRSGLARLHQLATSPGEPRALNARMRWGLLMVAALLLASGLIFWIAANWQEQTRLFKLGLIEGALALSVLAALLLPRVRIPALLCAHLALGGLLAFVGQTYQTGADAWQLFAVWAALSLIWTALARSDVLWSLWVLVAATSITMWMGRWGFFEVLFGEGQALLSDLIHMGLWLALALVPAVVSLIAPIRVAGGMGWWSHRLALAGALSAWVAIGVVYLFDSSRSGALYFAPGLLAAGALWLSLQGRWRDFISVCIAALALNAWVLVGMGRLFGQVETSDVLFLFTVVGLACLGGTVTGLIAVQKRMRDEDRAFAASAASAEGSAA